MKYLQKFKLYENNNDLSKLNDNMLNKVIITKKEKGGGYSDTPLGNKQITFIIKPTIIQYNKISFNGNNLITREYKNLKISANFLTYPNTYNEYDILTLPDFAKKYDVEMIEIYNIVSTDNSSKVGWFIESCLEIKNFLETLPEIKQLIKTREYNI